jgi:ligand-binding sensor domain-containing protein
MRLSCFLIASLFISVPVLAQNQYGDLFYFVNADDIRGIAQDGNILWIATYGGGLVKFDKTTNQKTNFLRTNNGLTSHELTSIAIDADHTLWIGTNLKGIISFDGTNWKSHTYANENLPSNGIRSLVFDKKGRLWAATDNGLTYRDSAKWNTFTPDNSNAPSIYCLTLALDSTGKIWAGFQGDNVQGGTVGYVENDTLLMANANGSFAPLPQSVFTHIETDTKGSVWFGADFSTLYSYSYQDNYWQNYDVSIGRSPNVIYDVSGVYSLGGDTKGGMWVMTEFALLHYDSTGTDPSAFIYDSTAQMPQGQGGIKADGNLLWYGATFGLTKFDMTSWQTTDLSNCSLKGNNVTNVKLAPSGAVWVNDNISICRFDNGIWSNVDYKFQTQPQNPLKLTNGFQNIVLDGDSLKWILFGYNGCVEYGSPYSTQFFAGSDTDEALGLSQGIVHNGQSYFVKYNARQYSPVIFDGSHFNNMILPKDTGVVVANCNSFTFDKFNTLWFSEEFLGVIEYDGANWTKYNPITENLPFHSIRQIEFDSLGDWYGASDNGLITHPQKNQWQSNLIDPQNSTTNNLASLAVESDHSIYTLSENGTIAHYDGTSWEVLDTDKLPLPEQVPFAPTCTLDSKGNLWITTTYEGIVVYHKNGVTFGVSASVNGRGLEEKCKVYPNPAIDKATIITSENREIKEIRLLDLLGRLVLDIRSPLNNQINISELPEGCYTLICTASDGNIMVSKIVKR